jgi:inosine-uridine nucleoside N-ribohydrolase
LIGGLTVIGGSFSGVGINTAFSTEFNFNADADAAALVIKHFKNITIVPIEMAFETLIDKNELNRFFTNDTSNKGRFIKDLCQNIGHMVFDPLAAFAMMMPESVLKVYRIYGEVMREGPRTKGFLSLAWLKSKEINEPNLQVIC